MANEFNLGSLSKGGSSSANLKKNRKFRLAVLGDFSGRASRGELESGDALSSRKPLKVEADNIDTLLSRLSPTLKLALPGSGNVELEFGSMDDFHPDQLYDKLEIFSDLSGLRQRLKGSSSFAKAAAELRAIGLDTPPEPVTVPVARGTVIDANASLDDFLQSVDRTTDEAEEIDPKTSLDAFLHGVLAPYLTASKNPQQDQFVAVADEAISAMMREVLHHPDFRALESAWRSLAFLASRLETDETLQIVMIDLSAEEFAADLAASDTEPGALHRLLVEQPAEDERTGPYSAVVGNYIFDRTSAHADLLGRIAKIVAQAPAPFISSVPANTLDGKPDDLDPAIRDAWETLRALPEAGYLALSLPRFMLRMPYGKKTDPIEAFKFEEFTPKVGLKAMLWANPAVAVGLLLAQTFRQQGDAMRPGTVSGLDEMPYYVYTDADGDQTALPCTERFLNSTVSEGMTSQGFLPLLAVKNSPEIRVSVFRSLGGSGLLAGWWTTAAASSGGAAAAAVAAGAVAGEGATSESDTSETGESADTTEETSASSDASSGDADLDALLAGLGGDSPSETSETPAEPKAGESDTNEDDELAKLLAGLE